MASENTNVPQQLKAYIWSYVVNQQGTLVKISDFSHCKTQCSSVPLTVKPKIAGRHTEQAVEKRW